jgi:hypothetical protein
MLESNLTNIIISDLTKDIILTLPSTNVGNMFAYNILVHNPSKFNITFKTDNTDTIMQDRAYTLPNLELESNVYPYQLNILYKANVKDWIIF